MLDNAPLDTYMALSVPMPLGVFMVVQVPASTYFQALAWKSVLEVPAQVVPGPAAQSFLPAMATP
jgi:hypothetical protein